MAIGHSLRLNRHEIQDKNGICENLAPERSHLAVVVCYKLRCTTDQQANHAEVMSDWLVDKFAIAGTVDQCRAQIERIKKTGIQQIAIIPYSCHGEHREATLKGFAKAMG